MRRLTAPLALLLRARPLAGGSCNVLGTGLPCRLDPPDLFPPSEEPRRRICRSTPQASPGGRLFGVP